ncbi:hypothetical protein [Desulfovibrio litoralis]|uniref:Uncharacterized protein n=1 Tax=Desulfovibrio litoralis DSM 11393 TaxID=1121455 RepID=A0A1M7SES7_9BACT|nr:hypothetical protein [Desulfovibrio litoralis]SHN56999.1 hypothetical protein SAMN02745728_00858 [Desulfovibrio litoralis DSM 11393]
MQKKYLLILSLILSFNIVCVQASIGLAKTNAILLAQAEDGEKTENSAKHPAIAIIKETQKAIDTANLEMFLGRVDVEALTNQVVGVFLNRLPSIADKMAEKGVLPPMLVLASSAVNKGPNSMEYQTSKAFLAAAARQFLQDGVSSGAFAGKKYNPSGILTDELFTGISKGRKELVYPQIEHAGKNTATVNALFKDHGTGDVFPLVLRLQNNKGIWKIQQIENIDSIFNTLEKQLDAQ